MNHPRLQVFFGQTEHHCSQRVLKILSLVGHWIARIRTKHGSERSAAGSRALDRAHTDKTQTKRGVAAFSRNGHTPFIDAVLKIQVLVNVDICSVYF